MPPAASTDTVPRAVGRVLDLLEIVLAQPCNLTAAAREAGLTPTTARRHLVALEARGYVTRDDANMYRAGPAVRHFTAAIAGRADRDRLIDVAQPHLDELAAATGESAYLALGTDVDLVEYVATAESRRAIRHVGWVGQTVPADGTAVGAALAEPGRCIRRTGAVEPDISAISFGLESYRSLRPALSLVGPSHRFDEVACDDHERRLVDAARELAAALAGAPTDETEAHP